MGHEREIRRRRLGPNVAPWNYASCKGSRSRACGGVARTLKRVVWERKPERDRASYCERRDKYLPSSAASSAVAVFTTRK